LAPFPGQVKFQTELEKLDIFFANILDFHRVKFLIEFFIFSVKIRARLQFLVMSSAQPTLQQNEDNNYYYYSKARILKKLSL
jgi:hypothetical protein